MKQALPQPPAHISEPTRLWWTAVVKKYEFEAHDLALLQIAAEALDEKEAARLIIQKEGPTYTDGKGNPCKHPAVTIGNDAKTAYRQAMRELRLSDEPLPENRPPRR